MPTDYNPDEIARAKHLVALADAINTKINTVSARTSRPVSLAYKKSDNTYAQLDSAASSVSIPFENLTAILRIASGDEDIVPTITLSNNVTASTPTYSNGAFETTLTLPGASVTSFSMTIALPQTENFSAWQKTFTVDTTADKTARNPVVRYWHYGEGTSVEYGFDLAQSSYTLPLSVFSTANKFQWEYKNNPGIPTDTARVYVHDCSTTGSTTISATHAGQEFPGIYNVVFNWTLAKEPQTLTFTVSLIETATHQA